ncbi:hypothetical protein PG995_005840 [Apiospora arundinis]
MDLPDRDAWAHGRDIMNDVETSLKACKVLLEFGADPNARYEDTTTLHKRARYHPDGLVPNPYMELLLDQPHVDIEIRDADGCTPLLVACFLHDDESIRLLLDKGADIRAKDFKGTTALHLWVADMIECEDSVDMPLSRLISLAPELLNHLDGDGKSVLHKGLCNKNGPHARSHDGEKQRRRGSAVLAVEPLLWDLFDEAGIDWLAFNHKRQSLLHVVAASGGVDLEGSGRQRAVDVATVEGFRTKSQPVVNGIEAYRSGRRVAQFRFLLSKGLDPAAEDVDGQTPLDIAAMHGYQDILDLFSVDAHS